MKSRIVLTLAVASLCSAQAENWPQWHGPHFDGSSSETGLPADFSKTNNVRWVTPLPGPSAATPIILGDRVFVSSTDQNTRTLHALGLDRKNGQVLWNEEVGAGYNLDDLSNFASPSPVTDGQVVVFLYGNGLLAGFDFKGKKLWAHDLQKDYGQFAYQWTYGSSPTLYAGKLFLQILQRSEPVHGRGRTDGPIDSLLLALEPKTGRQIWKHVRPSDAHQESKEAYSTPIPFEGAGRTELLIVGGDYISGHSLADGAEYWHWGTWNPTRIGHWRLVPSPVTGDGMVLACAPKGAPVYAFKTGSKGDLGEAGVAWKSAGRDVASDVCTPLYYQGRFYVLNGDRRTLSRIEPATGKIEWTGELDSRIKIESSPTGADGRIFFQNFRGEVFVVAAAPEFKLLLKVPMGDDDDDRVRASIAVSQGELFIRTGHKLYCIGKAK
jgi:outer membrane protein assembly factor BamB